MHDRSLWREWLAENHVSSGGIWLVFYRKGFGDQSLSYDESVREALCFGWIDSIIRKLNHERYARKFTPRKRDSGWSASNRRRVADLVEQGLMTETGLSLVEEAKRSGSWLGSPVPEVPEEIPGELAEALEASPGAQEFWSGLAPSYRKRFVLWVAMAKREKTRTARVRESIELMEKGEKLGLR